MSMILSIGLGVLITAGFWAFYMLPFIVADNRGLTNRWSIFFLNLFLGWTLVGLGGAMLVGSAALWVMRGDALSTLRAACGPRRTSWGRRQAISTMPADT